MRQAQAIYGEAAMGALYRADFAIRDNADWRNTFELRDQEGPWDLSGAQMTLTLKKDKSADPADTLVLTVGHGLVLLDARAGLFEIRVLAPAIGAMKSGLYNYDMLVVQAGVTTALLAGQVRIEAGVS